MNRQSDISRDAPGLIRSSTPVVAAVFHLNSRKEQGTRVIYDVIPVGNRHSVLLPFDLWFGDSAGITLETDPGSNDRRNVSWTRFNRRRNWKERKRKRKTQLRHSMMTAATNNTTIQHFRFLDENSSSIEVHLKRQKVSGQISPHFASKRHSYWIYYAQRFHRDHRLMPSV